MLQHEGVEAPPPLAVLFAGQAKDATLAIGHLEAVVAGVAGVVVEVKDGLITTAAEVKDGLITARAVKDGLITTATALKDGLITTVRAITILLHLTAVLEFINTLREMNGFKSNRIGTTFFLWR